MEFLITLLVLLLPSSVAGHLDNQDLDLAQYAYQVAVSENINPKKFLALINCESSWQVNARGDFRTETGEFKAVGLLQFWQGTWDTYSKKYGIIGERKNHYSQILLGAIMIGREKNGWKHWFNCMNAINWKGE